jgi:DTW domain-containing protein YfiP
MPRTDCPRCAYPQQSCVCYAINETGYQTQIVVLQHPSEVKHAKNTARLISLVAPETETIVGEIPKDFCAVRGRLMSNPNAVILFPTATSLALDESMDSMPIDTLIIIDGTWRKAKKIWLSNPWLHEMRVCHLKSPISSRYHIRSSRQPDGLASIEAAASALSQLGERNTDALLDALIAMQKCWPSRN